MRVRLPEKELRAGLLEYANNDAAKKFTKELKLHNRGVRKRWTKKLYNIQRRVARMHARHEANRRRSILNALAEHTSLPMEQIRRDEREAAANPLN